MAMNLTQGAARATIKPDEAKTLRQAGVLVDDPRRDRPRYFDGRFLAARDLIRDQQYFLTREADLGRAAGSGVAQGLFVAPGATPQAISIAEGHGITPAGELVLLPRQLDLNLADIPLAEQYSARFGLSRLPAPPLRSRTGLYVLALRPVEFTANPVGAYPTSLTGPRTVEDGDVIEATAVVLVPWQDDGAADDLEARRGRAARTLFGDGKADGVSANVLPIAMLALLGNNIVWIDEAMVRRELGANRGDLPGLGFAPRALRLAHLMQHQSHLADVVAAMGGRSFPAASVFPLLPPAGPLPAGCIDTSDFTQRYFPSMVDVDFSIIPDDELPALVEEALALPPIDFLASEAALDLTAVLVLAPVPRAEFRATLAALESRTRALKPAAPNQVAQRKPLEILQRLRIPLPLEKPDVANPSDAMWVKLAKQDNLWYVRRRNLAYRDDLAGTPLAVSGGNDIAIERDVVARVANLGLKANLDKVLAGASTVAAPKVIGLLATPRIAESPSLTAATLGALAEETRSDASSAPGSLSQAGVLKVAADMTTQGVGDGLLRIENTAEPDKAALARLASNDAWRKLDAQAATATHATLDNLAARVAPRPAAPAPSTETPAAGAAPVRPAVAKAATTPAQPAATAKPAATKARATKVAAKPAAAKSGAAKATAKPARAPAAKKSK